MNRATREVVIVGGGTAGWIAANAIATECRHWAEPLRVTLVESPDIPTIGVGEGTWPSMRGTLQRIGIDEDEMLRACDASFKQGTWFRGWSGRSGEDAYIHPFSLPVEYARLNPASYWLRERNEQPFARFATPQVAAIERGLAPKEASAPQYAFAFNYAYHLDAGKFAGLLERHATEQRGVVHILANVAHIEAHESGDIAALLLDTGARIAGDLFIDCTGQRALLIGQHYGQRFTSARDTLFNDRAVVVQVTHESANAAIASATLATAQPSGWIWDIGLQTRRGLGHVHSSAHMDESAAQEALARYVASTSPGSDPTSLPYRTIVFEPGYRETPWHRNCVAIGLSAGFVEPLEASALALIEQSAAIVAQQMPRDRQVMDVVAKRFNERLRYHWQRIVEFLKLHYAISAREEPYWQAHREQGTWPSGLADKFLLWQQQPPWHDDAPRLDELFPSASYQYVLYGMGFRPRHAGGDSPAYLALRAQADQVFHATRAKAAQLTKLLPSNRDLLGTIAARTQTRQANGA